MLQMVNGYVCRDGTDVQIAKKGADPVQQRPRVPPFWPHTHGDEAIIRSPSVPPHAPQQVAGQVSTVAPPAVAQSEKAAPEKVPEQPGAVLNVSG